MFIKIGTNKPPFIPGNSRLSLSRVLTLPSFDLTMDLFECIELQRGSRMNLIQWLQQRSLLANPLRCRQCNQDMEMKERNGDHVDGFHW